MILRAVTLLPQPDSPTSPIVSPCGIENEMPSTARTIPSRVRKWVSRLTTRSRSAVGAPLAPARRGFNAREQSGSRVGRVLAYGAGVERSGHPEIDPSLSASTTTRHPAIINPMLKGRLWRHRDFLKLWTGETVSQFGSQVTLLAVT